MVYARDVAKYFLSKDEEKKLFNKNLIECNGRSCYEGNIRLNKYLYFAQTVYLARYGKLLFDEPIQAYDNGPIVKDVMTKYAVMKASKNKNINLDKDVTTFLDKIYDALKDATYQELVDITYEDTAWKDLSDKTYNAPVIDIMKYQKKYEKQYKGLIKIMEI